MVLLQCLMRAKQQRLQVGNTIFLITPWWLCFALFFSVSIPAASKIYDSWDLSDNGCVFSLAEDPKVVSVFPNQARKLHTTRSWDFLGLENNGKIPDYSAWKVGRFGEDTIIGTLDTGDSYILFYCKIDCFFLSRRVKKIWKCCMHVSSLANFFIQALEVDDDDCHMFCITALTWTYLTQ